MSDGVIHTKRRPHNENQRKSHLKKRKYFHLSKIMLKKFFFSIARGQDNLGHIPTLLNAEN